jgi:hypothetical protein
MIQKNNNHLKRDEKMLFTKETSFNLAKDITAVLKASGLEEKHDIIFTQGRTRWGDNDLTMTIEAGNVQNGVVLNKDAREYNFYVKYRDNTLKPLGSEFTFQGFKYIITGMKPRSKNSLIAKRISNGSSYKLPLSAIE